MNRQTTSFALIVLLALANSARSEFISEILIEPDGPRQFFELQGTPGASLNGLTFVVISGEGNGSIIGDSGTIDQFLNLDGFSFGSNGLLLWASRPIPFFPPPPFDPPADPGTTVIDAAFNPGFFPTFIAEASQTFALVSGFSGFSGQDLDTNNDGILDGPLPWTGVMDAIGIRENDFSPDNEFAFGEQLGFSDFPVTGFDPDSVFRDGVTGEWYAADVDNPGSPNGPYVLNPSEFDDINGNPADVADFNGNALTPGRTNISVPEPGSACLLTLASLCVVFSSSRRRLA